MTSYREVSLIDLENHRFSSSFCSNIYFLIRSSGVRPQENQFVMPDLTFGLRGSMRRMYLTRNVRQNNRLFWVGVARPTMAVVQVTVMKVVDPAAAVSSRWRTEPPGLKFRLSTVNATGRFQPRGKPRTVCWDRTALARSASAMEHGVSPPVCRSALYSPHHCIATIANDQTHEALISWGPE